MGPISNCFGAVLLAVVAFSIPAASLDISLRVTDKLGKPVSGAVACFQEDAGQCGETNAGGLATLAATVGLRPGIAPTGPTAPIAPDGVSFDLRGGTLRLLSPVAQTARVARFDARGRAFGPEMVVRLRPGANALAWPEARAGLNFFRVALPGTAFTGKVLALTGGPAIGLAEPAGARASGWAALGKVAAANLHAVTIAKSGFRTVTYRPRTDHDTGVVIRLSAESDSGIPYAGVIRAKVDAIDTANHVVNYTYNETRCAGSAQNTVELHSSLPFWIRDGNWFFPAGNCQGVALAKESEGFFGSWKTVGVREYPAGLLPVTCDPIKDSLVMGVVNLFFINEGGGWDIDLRADSLTIRIRRELCPGNQAVFDPLYYDGKEGRPLLAGNTCREVEFRNPSDEPGTYSFSRESDSLRGVFAFKDKSCPTPGVSLNIDSNGPKKCPEPVQVPLAQDTAFQHCVFNTGFMAQGQ
jgi:hypothetical protein